MKTNINWDFFLLSKKKKRVNLTSWNIKGMFLAFGKGFLLNPLMCVYIKNRKLGTINSSLCLRRYIEMEGYYINFPTYFGGIFSLKRHSHNYAKLVRCSRLLKARQLW